jgi:formamidopyrimidine-DNA glycosylase
MEGKYNIRNNGDTYDKHEHVVFKFVDGTELRYRDTRKFGRMHLIEKEKVYDTKPLNELGLEPWDKQLTIRYLKEKYKSKRLPIKTVVLDQSIIVGIGNIYADEILFLSNINPYTRACDLKDEDLENIIKNTRKVLKEAIEMGGTTIRTYTSSDGVHGKFQQSLLVHNNAGEDCPTCGTTIIKTKINGRGTYYCPKCQTR